MRLMNLWILAVLVTSSVFSVCDETTDLAEVQKSLPEGVRLVPLKDAWRCPFVFGMAQDKNAASGERWIMTPSQNFIRDCLQRALDAAKVRLQSHPGLEDFILVAPMRGGIDALVLKTMWECKPIVSQTLLGSQQAGSGIIKTPGLEGKHLFIIADDTVDSCLTLSRAIRNLLKNAERDETPHVVLCTAILKKGRIENAYAQLNGQKVNFEKVSFKGEVSERLKRRLSLELCQEYYDAVGTNEKERFAALFAKANESLDPTTFFSDAVYQNFVWLKYLQYVDTDVIHAIHVDSFVKNGLCSAQESEEAWLSFYHMSINSHIAEVYDIPIADAIKAKKADFFVEPMLWVHGAHSDRAFAYCTPAVGTNQMEERDPSLASRYDSPIWMVYQEYDGSRTWTNIADYCKYLSHYTSGSTVALILPTARKLAQEMVPMENVDALLEEGRSKIVEQMQAAFAKAGKDVTQQLWTCDWQLPGQTVLIEPDGRTEHVARLKAPIYGQKYKTYGDARNPMVKTFDNIGKLWSRSVVFPDALGHLLV